MVAGKSFARNDYRARKTRGHYKEKAKRAGAM